MSDAFISRWGIKDLDDERWIHVPGFIMRNWSKFVTVAEWAFILQVMSYKYDTEKGAAKPSLSSIQSEMGYDQIRSVQRLKSSLIEKGLLRVTWVPGYPDTYYFNEFTKSCKVADETRDKKDTPQAVPEQGMTKMTEGDTSKMSEGDMTKKTDEELEVKDSESKNENLKDSSALRSEDASIIAAADSDSHNLVQSPEVAAPVEKPAVIQAVEESASQELAPETSEVSPVEEAPALEAEQLHPDPIAPEKTPDAEVAGVIEEAEELVKENAKYLDQCYQEVTRRALGKPNEPLKAGGYVGRYIKFLKGAYVKGEEGAGKETLEFQLSEAMLPGEIAGLALCCRKEWGLDNIPHKYDALSRRCEQFRALPSHDTWVAEGQKRLEQIMGGAVADASSGHNNHRRPTEADYAAPNTPLPTNALARLKEMAPTGPKVKP